jgi:hypothetical protein
LGRINTMITKVLSGGLLLLALTVLTGPIALADPARQVTCEDGAKITAPGGSSKSNDELCVSHGGANQVNSQGGKIVSFTSSSNPAGAGKCADRVFTFPTWYRGVYNPSTCDIKVTKLDDFIKIPLNVLEVLIQVVMYVSAGYILWGGFKYMKSQGDPSGISGAKMTIINAVAGLAIALSSVAIVEFIQTRLQ